KKKGMPGDDEFNAVPDDELEDYADEDEEDDELFGDDDLDEDDELGDDDEDFDEEFEDDDSAEEDDWGDVGGVEESPRFARADPDDSRPKVLRGPCPQLAQCLGLWRGS